MPGDTQALWFLLGVIHDETQNREVDKDMMDDFCRINNYVGWYESPFSAEEELVYGVETFVSGILKRRGLNVNENSSEAGKKKKCIIQ